MITKEQAMIVKSFKQVYAATYNSFSHPSPLDTPIAWRANGKCKVWKRSPDRFSLPVKHGLYSYGYITEENANLFEPA
jgi:hypothetical protein